MDSSDGSCPRTRSGIIRAKPTATVGTKNEPAGEGLPDGWLKEYRPRKNASASRIKGDMFYIDPISGYEFRSLKDVHRYLGSGDINSCNSRPHKRKIEDLCIARNQSHHTGMPSHHRQMETSGQCTRCDMQTEEGNTPLREALVTPERESAKKMPPSGPEVLSPTQNVADKVEASEGNKNIIQSAFIKHAPEEAESVTGKEANVEQISKEKKRKGKPTSQIGMPRRASPRLAALKVSQETNSEPKDEPISIKTGIANQLQPNPKAEADSSLVPEQKNGAPTRSSLEKVGNEDSSVVKQIDGASIASSSANVGNQTAPAEVLVPPQQIGSGETTDDFSGSTLSSLFGNGWLDPCIEFAFKTLTGDIPILDDTVAVTNYFLQPQDLNKGTTPNCSSSAYDGTRNHAQVNHVSLPMQRPSDKLYNGSWFPPQ